MKHCFAFFLSLFVSISSALADQPLNVLYGLTTDGNLKVVSQTNGVTLPKRGPLPSGSYYGITYAAAGGQKYFYTYKYNGSVSTLYRFGFQNGDEVALGSTSYLVRGLATRPSDGAVFAALSTDAIGRVSLADGTISNVVNLTDCYFPPPFSGPSTGLRAIAFRSDDQLLGTSWNTGFSYYYRINLSTGEIYGRMSNGDSSCSGATPPPYAGAQRFMGLAIKPSDQRIFATYPTVNNHTNLYEIFDAYPQAEYSSESAFGQATDQVIHGVTFGPAGVQNRIPYDLLLEDD